MKKVLLFCTFVCILALSCESPTAPEEPTINGKFRGTAQTYTYVADKLYAYWGRYDFTFNAERGTYYIDLHDQEVPMGWEQGTYELFPDGEDWLIVLHLATCAGTLEDYLYPRHIKLWGDSTLQWGYTDGSWDMWLYRTSWDS